MRRAVVVFLVLVSLLCNGFAVANEGFADVSEDVEHALLHVRGTHHHHEHLGFDVDDSDESLQHLLLDAVLHAPVVASAMAPFGAAAPGTARPAADDDAAPPSAVLDGRRRPPRA